MMISISTYNLGLIVVGLCSLYGLFRMPEKWLRIVQFIAFIAIIYPMIRSGFDL